MNEMKTYYENKPFELKIEIIDHVDTTEIRINDNVWIDLITPCVKAISELPIKILSKLLYNSLSVVQNSHIRYTMKSDRFTVIRLCTNALAKMLKVHFTTYIE